MAAERLHKIMAARGVGSRRTCEELISEGRVSVDGVPVMKLGTKVDEGAEIRVDGTVLKEPQRLYCLLHKPRGVVTTMSDEKGRMCVGDLVKKLRDRVYPVGRLDEDSEGLLLLTNDGRLANILTHPRFGVEKTYKVKVRGRVKGEALERLRRGIHLREGLAAAKVKLTKATRNASALLMTINRGYNRQIRRMCSAVGHPVMRLTRIAFGPLALKSLPSGVMRPLRPTEVDSLSKLAEKAAERAAEKRKKPRRPRKDSPHGKVGKRKQSR